MAEPGYTGTPDVEPSTQAAGAYERIQVDPNAFGAGLGEAFQGAGANVMHTSQFYGKVAADNATNNYMDESNKILYGDPTQKLAMGPDGKAASSPSGGAVYDGGFFSLRGQDALNAQASTYQKLNDVITRERANLPSAYAREQFDVDSRRMRARTMAEMGQHADTEYKTWQATVYNTAATAGLNDVSNVAASDELSAQAGQRVIDARRMTALIKGEDPAGADLQAHQEVALARVRRLLVDNPGRAAEVFDASKNLLGSLPQYDQIGRAVKTASFDQKLPSFIQAQTDKMFADASAQVGDASAEGGGWSAIPKTPTGGNYDRIAQIATAHGANPVEVQFVQMEAHNESHGDPEAVNPSHTRFGAFQYRTPGTLEQQTVQALQDGRANAAKLRGMGIIPTPANLYMMHQQGAGGGPALLRASPDANAIDALTPAYRGNRQLATEAIAHNIGVNYKAPGGEAAALAKAATMTVGEFRQLQADQFFGGKAPAGATGTGGGAVYPTQADALAAQDPRPALVKAAAEAFPDFPDQQARAVEEVMRAREQRITTLNAQYDVSSHIVEAAVADPNNPPISMTELQAKSPEVAQALEVMQEHNPYGFMAIERRLNTNAHGQALIYGGEFFDYFNRVTASSTDPNAIRDIAVLNHVVGNGPESPLTNTGAHQLTQLMALRTTASGEASLAQIQRFGDTMHKAMSGSDPTQGTYDQKGEVEYTKFMAAIFPQLVAAAKQGPAPLGKLLNPDSPDYLGKAARPFLRSATQQLTDSLEFTVHTTPTGISLTQLQAATQGHSMAEINAYGRAKVADGSLAPAVWDAYVKAHSAPAPAAPVAPGPGGGYPLVAPAPRPFEAQ